MNRILRQFPLTACCVVVIFVLCLIPIPETPLDDVPFIDKWTHMVLYGGLTLVFWAELGRSAYPYRSPRLLLVATLVPVAMGGFIELLQAFATTCRSGDWLDFAANSLGAVVGTALGRLLVAPATHRLLRRKA